MLISEKNTHRQIDDHVVANVNALKAYQIPQVFEQLFLRFNRWVHLVAYPFEIKHDFHEDASDQLLVDCADVAAVQREWHFLVGLKSTS